MIGRRGRVATCLTLAAACLALAGAGGFGLFVPPRARVVLLDVSASVARTPGLTAAELLQRGCQGLTAGDSVAVVAFADRPRLATPFRRFGAGVLESAGFQELAEGLDPFASDLDAAVAFACTLAKSKVRGEVVVVSDGLATSRGPRGEAEVPVAMVAVPPLSNHAVSAVLTPARAAPGTRVGVRVVVASRVPSSAPRAVHVKAEAGGEAFWAVELPLTLGPAGDLTAEASFVMPRAPHVEVVAAIDGRDAVPEDDEGRALILAAGTTRVGIVGSPPLLWLRALQEAPGLDVVEVTPPAWRTTPVDLLIGVDWGLPLWRHFAPEAAAFVAAGGAFLYATGPAGFTRAHADVASPEAWLPLRPADAEADEDVLLLLDASGSMAGVKLDAAKRALRAFVEGAGVRANVRASVFRSRLEDPIAATGERFESWLRSIEARGETDLVEVLDRARLRFDDPVKRRRIVLVSDGLHRGSRAPLSEARRLGEGLRAAGVRLSAYAVGADSDREFLEELTLRGANGDAHDVQDLESLPAALAGAWAESRLATGGPVAVAHPAGAPFVVEALPGVAACVKTEPTEGGLVLASASGVPLLAWKVGLRSAILTTLPGTPLAPDFVPLTEFWGSLATALAAPGRVEAAFLEGGRVLLEGAAASLGAATLTQGERRAELWRRGDGSLEGDARGLEPGPAALNTREGTPLGVLHVRACAPREASPLLTPVALSGIAALKDARPPSVKGADRRWILVALGALVAAALASRWPRAG